MSSTSSTPPGLTPTNESAPAQTASWVLSLLINMRGLWAAAGLMLGSMMAGIILVLTLTPPLYPEFGISYIDKVHHFVAFALLIFPIILTEPRRWVWALPVCIGLGGMIELVQPHFGRTAEWLDFGADVSGVLAGAAAAELMHDRIRGWAARVRGDSAQGMHDMDDAARREQLRNELRASMLAELSAPSARVPLAERTPASQPAAPSVKAARPRKLADPVEWPTAQDTMDVPPRHATAFSAQAVRH